MDSQGFITISRKLLEWEWIDDAGMVSLWLQLLLRANFEDKDWHGIHIKRGQFVTSVAALSKLTGMTTKMVRVRLDRLKESGCVAIKTTNKNSVITICNYDTYQLQPNAEWQAKGQTKGKQRATTKECNNNISLSYSACARENFGVHDIVSKQNIPMLTGIWIEEVQMMIKRQLGKMLTVEDIKTHYSEFLVQEVTEVTQATYQEFRQHFNNYVRKREQIKQQENGDSKKRQTSDDRLRAAKVSATSAKDYETTF